MCTKSLQASWPHNNDVLRITKGHSDHHVPVSSQKAQTGRADLVAEYVDLQSCVEFWNLRRLLYQAGLRLVDDPPLLDLARVALSSFQGHWYVKHLFIFEGSEQKQENKNIRIEYYEQRKQVFENN